MVSIAGGCTVDRDPMRIPGRPLITESHQAFTFTRRAMVLGGAQAEFGALLAARMGWI